SCLTDLSKQVEWFGKRMTPDGWKNWITGHLNGQELHPNIDGTGFISVTRGASTSGMTIPEMIAVIDLCHAFGADKEVN
ncbi:recombination protein NinB, partial [Streptococcus pneumoniae]|nr:recombination protein NinB [Streptococcus pneumoniae]